jgi:hypothetical protein
MRVVFCLTAACLALTALTATSPASSQDTASIVRDILFDVGPAYDQITYANQPRIAFNGTGSGAFVLTPSGTVYYDRESSSPGKLCVRYELQSPAYLDAFSAKLNTGLKLLLPPAQALTLYLGPLDEAEPPYTWVKSRTDNAHAATGNYWGTCFDIGARRDPEALAKASMVGAYYTTPAKTGTASQCNVALSLQDVSKNVSDANSVVTTGSTPNVLITGSQLSSLIGSKAASVDVTCAGADPDALKTVRAQIANAIPMILSRIDTTEATWDQLKGQMWSLGFSTSADTVIDTLKKNSNNTVSTQSLGLKAKDLAGFGITADGGRTVTENEENSTTTKVTIPASINVFRFGKSDLSRTETFSSRELNVTGDTAATLYLRSRFVEDGVLRVVNRLTVGQFPSNAIVAWFGNDAKDVPAGWAFCDGQIHAGSTGAIVKTPDLRGRFLRESGGSLGTTGGQESVSTGFTASSVRLPINEDNQQKRCVSTDTDSHDCNGWLPNPYYVASVSTAAQLPTVPPYTNVAFICKLP